MNDGRNKKRNGLQCIYITTVPFFLAQLYVCMLARYDPVPLFVCLSVWHKSALYRNGSMDRTDFGSELDWNFFRLGLSYTVDCEKI